MGRFVDNIIAFRILRLLTVPFEETDAYKLGIIDKRGKELKRMQDLHTDDELVAYTLLHRLVFRLKRIIEKVPIDNKKLVSYAAALALIKECVDKNIEPLDLEYRYLNKTRSNLTEELSYVESVLAKNHLFTFKQFTEEGEGAGGAVGAPENNIVATKGINRPEGKLLFKKPLRRKTNV